MENKATSDTSTNISEAPANADQQNTERRQLIVFKLGAEEYGIYIDQIKEVVLTPHITRMPQTQSYIKGVANIRGNILAIVDLEEKFGIQESAPEAEEDTSNYTLVVESQEFKIGILVKEVPNTLTVAKSEIDENVNLMQEGAEDGNYIVGVVKTNERLIVLIDLLKVMKTNELTGILKETATSI